MASLSQLQQLAYRANQATARFDRPVDPASVAQAAQDLVREAKLAGLACKRVEQADRTGYDCPDPRTHALFQVRVVRHGDLATLFAAVHGIDRARDRESAAESPLTQARREIADLRSDLARCRGDSPSEQTRQRGLFG